MSQASPIGDPVDITAVAEGKQPLADDHLATLEEIQRRVLWLSALIIHHANNVRPNPDRIKVGGHQASCASAVSIMTALYFHALQQGDRISIKPHASPVLHAIQYLIGNLDKKYLTTLRGYKGLQAYPSRTKDPFQVDFSTGSVGHGAVAPAFAALGHYYAKAHFGDVTSRRFISFIGDAELDEGNIWEAVIEEMGWHSLWEVEEPFAHVAAVLPTRPHTARMGEHYARTWLEIAGSLSESGAALVVSHGQLMEVELVSCLPEADHASWGPPFSHGEGFRLSVEDGTFTGVELLRVGSG
jgi:hypothetical protein